MTRSATYDVKEEIQGRSTHRASGLEAVRAFDGDLKLELVHVLTLANAKVATEEVLLELGHLGTNVAVLIIPFIDCRVLKVIGMAVITA